MAEESVSLREVREYRQRRDSGMEPEGEEEKWKDDGELLHKAARQGEVEVVQYLVEEEEVSVEVEDIYGRRPLHVAAVNGHLAVGRYLVGEGGADMEAGDEDRACAIHLTIMGGHRSFVEFLLEQGASVEAEDKWACRPLHVAAGFVLPCMVRCLLQQRAGSIDVNAQNGFGSTALHLAAGVAYSMFDDVEEDVVLEVVRFLVEEGEADPLLRNKDGKRASDSARDMEHSRVEKYLLEAEEMAEMQKQA